jgi:hypothetical protein
MTKQAGESGGSESQDAPGALDATDRPLQVGESIPARCYAADLMRIFGIKKSRFYELQQAGRFDRFELRPTIGRKAWSGELIAAYLRGDQAHSSRFAWSKKQSA